MDKLIGVVFYIFSTSIPLSITLSSIFAILIIIFPFFYPSDFLNFIKKFKIFYLLFLLLILSFLISSILSPFPLKSLKKGRDFLFYLLFPSILFLSLKYNVKKEKVLNFLITGGIISALYSFFLLIKGSALEGRAHGFFLQPIRYAEFMLFPVSAAFYFMLNQKEKKLKFLYALLFLTLSTALLLTDSRGGVICATLAVFIISFFKNKKISIFILISGLIVILFFFFKSPFKIRKQDIRKKSLHTRFELIKAFPEFFSKRPLFGYGRIDIKELLMEKDFKISEKNKELMISMIHFHFAPFQMLFYLGIIGTIFLYGLYFYIAYLLFKSKSKLKALGIGVLTGFLLQGVFGLNVIIDPNIFSIFLLTGLCIENEDNSFLRL